MATIRLGEGRMNKIFKFFHQYYFIISIFMILLSFMLGAFSASVVISKSESGSVTSEETGNKSAKEKINAETMVVYMTQFTKSESETVVEKKIDIDYIGKEVNEIKDKFKGWEFLGVIDNRVYLSREVDSYCPDSYKLGYVVNDKKNNVLALYKYDRDGIEQLDEVFDTPLELFSKEEIEKLKKGIIVYGEDNLNELLQNYVE